MTAVGTPLLPPRLAGDPSSVRGAARAVGQSGDAVSFGDDDPASGRVITAEGEQLAIGSTNGAQRIFGQNSWQWLLLWPLSR